MVNFQFVTFQLYSYAETVRHQLCTTTASHSTWAHHTHAHAYTHTHRMTAEEIGASLEQSVTMATWHSVWKLSSHHEIHSLFDAAQLCLPTSQHHWYKYSSQPYSYTLWVWQLY